MTEYKEDELAYDGSSNPQRRELTPRERDIICRVLSDILSVARNYDSDTHIPIVLFDRVPIRVSEPEFLKVLVDVRRALDPRD